MRGLCSCRERRKSSELVKRTALVVVSLATAALAAFAIYTWGWRDNGHSEADEQAVAEAYARALAGSCPDAPCTIEHLHREAPGVWAIALLAHGEEHCGTMQLDALPNTDESLTFTETGCP
jgi:hypothetical protein